MKMQDPDSSIRYEWMREFYRVRGDFAHGKLKTMQEMAWQPLEHVVLATIAFPLVIKALLEKAGRYTLTNYDRATVEAFERVSAEDFLNPPANGESSMDSWLSRLTNEARMKLITDSIVEKLQIERSLKDNGRRDAE